jgi:hypothetical protein
MRAAHAAAAGGQIMGCEERAADLERLAEFKARYPLIPVMIKAQRPFAWIDDGKIQADSLHDLLGELDRIYPPATADAR